jgi:hypothetical protein
MFHFWNVQRDRVRERNILRLRQNVICFMLLSYFDHAKCMIEMNAGEKERPRTHKRRESVIAATWGEGGSK